MEPSPQPKVVLSEHLADEAASWLARRVHLVRQSHEDAAALRRELADAEGLVVRTYTRVDADLLDAARRLQVVARAGVGLDNIDLAACRQRGVRVVHTPDANTQAVVEYVFALMLDAVRPRVDLDGYTPSAAFHRHRREHVGRQLDGMTLGVLGMGRIGRRVARVADAVGMRVLYHDLLDPAELKLPSDQPGERTQAAELEAASDILTIHVDGRGANRGLIGPEALAPLKRTCLLINTSRGFVIDPAALAAWAGDVFSDGGRAVLDVHDPEPPPEGHPLLALANVRLLPHLASRTRTALANMSWVVRDVARVLEGEEPEHAAV